MNMIIMKWVRICIVVGYNAVVQYGWATHTYAIKEKQITKKLDLDV
jgi:hypothetical protein